MIYSSHVGSFPIEYSDKNVVKAFEDMVNIGIDIIPYPQLRDFVKMFLEPLAETGFLHKYGDIYVWSGKRLDVLPKRLPREIYLISNMYEKYGGKILLRAPVTGAFTLASQIYLDKENTSLFNSLLKNRDIVLEDLSRYVKNIINNLVRLGYYLIIIDEPVLSMMIGGRRILFNYKALDIIEYYNFLAEKCSKMIGTHVCGRISPRLAQILLKTHLNILDHEYKDSPENFETYSFKMLEENDKYISVGCTSSKNSRVESVEEILKYIDKAYKLYGERLYIVKGDCGFRGLKGVPNAYNISINKLRNLVSALKSFNPNPQT